MWYEGYVVVTSNGMVKFGIGPLGRAKVSGTRCYHVTGPRPAILRWEHACLLAMAIPRVEEQRAASTGGYTEVRHRHGAIPVAIAAAAARGLSGTYDFGAYRDALAAAS